MISTNNKVENAPFSAKFRRRRVPYRNLLLFGFILCLMALNSIYPHAAAIASPLNQDDAPDINPTPTPSSTISPEATAEPADDASLLLQSLTPEERVGQLFLITFMGSEVGTDSPIFDLISNYHIGGVILLAKNDNITVGDGSPGGTAGSVIGLNRQLQMNSWQASLQEILDPESGETYSPAFIPLVIGISQEGDGYKFDQIINDLTQLPNEMALGATWEPDLARKVGTIVGAELSSLGVNLLLGPSLDILEVSHLDDANNLGTRSFGGDPYWVGELGKAYIEGVHLGSEGNIAVIAKHFPGHGGSDRLPEEEVATVRKTLDQLKSFELAPFFEVTGNAPSPEATADGLLTSHIRYQGFQGNIRATTRPVSFDPQALSLLMELPEFADWRADDGLLVSDDLGSQAIRRFYDLTSQPFDMPRRVALNAFLAGNDLLYVTDFSSGELDSITATKQTLEFFTQKYREDAAFAQRVDESVLRILRMKYRLFNEFTLADVLAPASGESAVGNNEDVSFEVSFKASTLLSPLQADLDENIPDPPNQNDRIVFISDTRSASQCSECPEQDILGIRTLENVVIHRYGPEAGGQVSPSNLISYELSDLELLLSSNRGDLPIERSLQRANWIVFSMLENTDENAPYEILSQFLSERPDLFQQKRMIVFALNAPYYLDATNISKLTAYYGLYSKINQFIDVAAYLLFKEHIAPGAPPVSVPGIGYDINKVLFPDPDQIISLELDIPVNEDQEGAETPEPTPTPNFRIGDVIAVRTGVIVDHNGNPVPDDTPVEFIMTTTGEVAPVTQVETTEGGVARTIFSVNQSGTIEITAESGNALSDVLRFEVPTAAEDASGDTGTQETPPPAEETDDIQPTATITQIQATATEASEGEQTEVYPPPGSKDPFILEWALAVLFSAGFGFVSYRLASINGGMLWGARTGFMVLIGGMLGYSYLIIKLPGSQELINQSTLLGVILATFIGAATGLLIVLSWRLVSEIRLRRKMTELQNNHSNDLEE